MGGTLGVRHGSARAHATLIKACCDLLKLKRIPHTRLNQKAHKQMDGSYRNQGADPGAPDIVGCLPGGVVLFIECKTGTARLRAEQLASLASWKSQGAACYVIRDVAQLDLALKQRAARFIVPNPAARTPAEL